MTGWKTDPEVNIGWRTPVVFQNRAYGEQAFEIKKMALGQDKRGQRASVSDRPPARTGTIYVVFTDLTGREDSRILPRTPFLTTEANRYLNCLI
jgi:hypothetical protein